MVDIDYGNEINYSYQDNEAGIADEVTVPGDILARLKFPVSVRVKM